MSVEVREEKPSERRFVVTRRGVAYEGVENAKSVERYTEAELRELVEKGAKALHLPEPSWAGAYTDMVIRKEQSAVRENTRLRAWLKRWSNDESVELWLLKEINRALTGDQVPEL